MCVRIIDSAEFYWKTFLLFVFFSSLVRSTNKFVRTYVVHIELLENHSHYRFYIRRRI